MSNIFTDAYRTVAICPEDDCRTISYLSQVNEGRQAVYYLPWNAAVIWNKKLEYRREPRTSGLIGLQGRQNKISEHQTKAGNQEHFLTLTRSHSLTLSLSHSITLDLLNKFCFNVYAQKSLSPSLIQSLLTCWTTFVFMSMFKSHSLSFTLSLSHSHSHTLSLFQSLIHSLSTCGTTFVFMLRVFLTRFITVLNRTG